MKKLLCSIAAFLVLFSSSSGQVKHFPGKISPGSLTCQEAVQFFKQCKGDHMEITPGEKQGILSDLSMEWTWDTVLVYSLYGLDYRITRIFDAGGRVITEYLMAWSSNTWVNSTRLTYTYTNSGNIQTLIMEEWYDNSWINYSKETYTYDANDNLQVQLYQIWSSNTWNNSYRDTFSYDATGNLLTETDEEWISDNWEYTLKYTYTYDANGFLVGILLQSWESNAWNNMNLYSYTNNASGNPVITILQSWENNSWTNFLKAIYTYNNNGFPVTLIMQLWQGSSWMDFGKMTYTYDGNNNLLMELMESWDGNTWQSNSRYVYTYDSNGNSITGKYEIWENNAWVADETTLDIMSQGIMIDYVYGHRYEASFISHVTSLQDRSANETSLRVFPNPAKEKITVELPFTGMNQSGILKVTDINGREIINEQIRDTKAELNILNLPSGMYFIEVSGNEHARNGKFIKY